MSLFSRTVLIRQISFREIIYVVIFVNLVEIIIILLDFCPICNVQKKSHRINEQFFQCKSDFSTDVYALTHFDGSEGVCFLIERFSSKLATTNKVAPPVISKMIEKLVSRTVRDSSKSFEHPIR